MGSLTAHGGGWATRGRWQQALIGKMLLEAMAITNYLLQAEYSQNRAGQRALAFCKPSSKISSTGSICNAGRWDRQRSLVICTRLLLQVSSSGAPSHQHDLFWLHPKGNALSLGASL